LKVNDDKQLVLNSIVSVPNPYEDLRPNWNKINISPFPDFQWTPNKFEGRIYCNGFIIAHPKDSHYWSNSKTNKIVDRFAITESRTVLSLIKPNIAVIDPNAKLNIHPTRTRIEWSDDWNEPLAKALTHWIIAYFIANHPQSLFDHDAVKPISINNIHCYRKNTYFEYDKLRWCWSDGRWSITEKNLLAVSRKQWLIEYPNNYQSVDLTGSLPWLQDKRFVFTPLIWKRKFRHTEVDEVFSVYNRSNRQGDSGFMIITSDLIKEYKISFPESVIDLTIFGPKRIINDSLHVLYWGDEDPPWSLIEKISQELTYFITKRFGFLLGRPIHYKRTSSLLADTWLKLFRTPFWDDSSFEIKKDNPLKYYLDGWGISPR